MYGTSTAVRALLIALAVAGLSAQAGGASDASQASQEGEVVWYSAAGTAAQLAPALNLWAKQHPDIKIDIVEAAGPDGMERVRTEERAHHVVADLFSQGDTGTFQALRDGLYQKYDPAALPNLRLIAPRVRPMIDPGGRVVPYYLMAYGITVNTQTLPQADWPHSWRDLLKPNVANTLGLHDIGSLGGGLSWYTVGRSPLGDAYFKQLAAEKPRVYARDPEMENAVDTGQRGAIVPATLQSYVASTAKNAPVKFIVPSDGMFFVTLYNGVVKGAPHPAAAQLFLNFLLSPQAQMVLAHTGDVPVIVTQISPIDLTHAKFLGAGIATQEQIAHGDDYLHSAQEIMGERQ